MYQVLYSQKAYLDIERIGEYLEENAGFLIARAVLERIITLAESLCEMPHRFTERSELKPGLYMAHTDGYLIFYTIQNHTVSIVTILNGRRHISADMF